MIGSLFRDFSIAITILDLAVAQSPVTVLITDRWPRAAPGHTSNFPIVHHAVFISIVFFKQLARLLIYSFGILNRFRYSPKASNTNFICSLDPKLGDLQVTRFRHSFRFRLLPRARVRARMPQEVLDLVAFVNVIAPADQIPLDRPRNLMRCDFPIAV